MWNSVEGKYLDEQEWTFHGRMIAEYEKESGMTYKAGICFVIEPPYSDYLDCIQVEAGQSSADDLVIEYGDEGEKTGIYDNEYELPKDSMS